MVRKCVACWVHSRHRRGEILFREGDRFLVRIWSNDLFDDIVGKGGVRGIPQTLGKGINPQSEVLGVRQMRGFSLFEVLSLAPIFEHAVLIKPHVSGENPHFLRLWNVKLPALRL
jgi:hypothetical protein